MRRIFFIFIFTAAFFSILAGGSRVLKDREAFIGDIVVAYDGFSSAIKSVKGGDITLAKNLIAGSEEGAKSLERNFFAKIISVTRNISLSLPIKELADSSEVAIGARERFMADLPVFVLTDGDRARKAIMETKSALQKVIDSAIVFRNQASVVGAAGDFSDYLAIQAELERSREILAAVEALSAKDGEVIFLLLNERQAAPIGGGVAAVATIPISGGEVKTRDFVVNEISKKVSARAVNFHNFNSFSDALPEMLGLTEYPQAVVAVNLFALSRVIKITGPIELPEEGVVLNEWNIKELALNKNSGRIFAKSLSEIAKSLKYFSAKERSGFSEEIYRLSEEKHIQIGFSKTHSSLRSGDVIFSEGDYLSIIGMFSSGENDPLRGKAEIEINLRSDGSSESEIILTRVSPEKMKGNLFWSLVIPEKAKEKEIVQVGKSGGEEPAAEAIVLTKGLKATKYRLSDKIFMTGYERRGEWSSRYRLIYERQPGADIALRLKINAPGGYVFSGSGRGEYFYESDDPPERLIITLDLEKIRL